MGHAVDWELARRIAGRVAGGEVPTPAVDDLETDLLDLTARAEEYVASETGLESDAGQAKAKVTDRDGWIGANLASFDRLMRPLLGAFEDDEPPSGPIGRFLAPVSDAVGPRMAAAELGALLGWMSRRVIGQYDLLIIEDERPEDQDWVYYVGPNVRMLEQRYGFPPREFRLWIALHECTHRAQFTGVPWLRPYFLGLVNELLDNVDPDPSSLLDTLKDAAAAKRRGEGPSLAEGGLGALLASPEQKATLDKMTGLMSLLEGHGDITMDRAGAGLIPSQPRFARVMASRRKQAKGPNKLIQRVLGFEAKLAQYEEGESFIHAVEARGGRSLFDRVWEDAGHLPDIAEIREPQRWIDRMATTS
ncbi:MAG: zinc-dependent metalloprotease [Acidimicrobiales bacterium]